MIIALFGLPGTGKSYFGKLLSKKYYVPFYDGDEDIPEKLRNIIRKGCIVPNDLRDQYFKKVIAKLKSLQKKNPLIIFCQCLPKQRSRDQLKNTFGKDMHFVLLTASQPILRKRLKQRKHDFVDPHYFDVVLSFFEKPTMTHHIIKTNKPEKEVMKSFSNLFKKYASYLTP